MPPIEPLENLRKLFEEAVKIILKLFPSVAVGIVTIFIAIILLLLYLFQGIAIAP
jgi:hypothetical protein